MRKIGLSDDAKRFFALFERMEHDFGEPEPMLHVGGHSPHIALLPPQLFQYFLGSMPVGPTI